MHDQPMSFGLYELSEMNKECQADLVSVIIPTFNRASMVVEAMDSVWSQTYRPLELIVVDDGSTDDTSEVVAHWASEHSSDKPFELRYLRQENRGAPAARNLGLTESRGKFIQFLDSDDLLYPSKIQLQHEHTQTLRENIISFCDADRTHSPVGPVVESYCRTDWHPGIDPVVLVLADRFPTPGPLHRRAHLMQVRGFDETLPCCQENDLHLRLAINGKAFARLCGCLYRIRTVSERITKNAEKIWRVRTQIVLPRSVHLMRENGVLTEERAKALAERLACDGRRLVGCQLYEEARAALHLARALHPSGGLEAAFRHPVKRVAMTFLGLVWTERLVLSAARCARRVGHVKGLGCVKEPASGTTRDPACR